MTPLYIIGGVLLLGLLYVVLPLCGETFATYRKPRRVRCPEERADAQIQIDPWRAAATLPFGPPRLKVRACSLWPKRAGCEEACLKEP